MREPPLGLEDVPHPALEAFFDEILAAPTTEELVFGLYRRAMPALSAACDRYMTDTNPLADAPSRRVLKFASIELDEMIDFEDWFVNISVFKLPFQDFERVLGDLLRLGGGVDGIAESPLAATNGLAPDPLPRRYSATPYVYDPVPRSGTSGSATRGTRASTPRRSSTTRRSRLAPRR